MGSVWSRNYCIICGGSDLFNYRLDCRLKGRRKMKRIIAIAILLVVICGIPVYAGEFFDSQEINSYMLESRNGKLIVERMIGIVLDDAGNGQMLNTSDPVYNYVNYAGISGIRAGDIVITYLVYNPETNFIDDIIQRSDWVVGNIYDYDQWEIPYIWESSVK